MKMKSQKFKQTEIGKIPEDWEVTPLSEKIEIIGGGTPKTTVKEYWDGEIPWISVADFVGDKRFIYDTEKSITNKGLKESSTNILKKEQVIISARGTVGEIGQVSKDMAFNQSCYGLDGREKINNNFLYYLLKKKVKDIQGKSHGAVFNTITKETFNQIIVVLPPIPEQKAIASILSSLDSKIELNNKMNKTLEAIGQAIFKKWFVDGGKEAWEEGFFNDKILTELIKPGIDKFGGEKIYLPTANISNSSITNYDYKITFEERPSRASMQPKENTIWFAKMKDSPKIQLFLDGEDWRLNNLILSTGFAGIKPKKEALFYIWNIINSPLFERKKDNLAMGTTMQAINNANIEKIKYLIPDKTVLLEFNQLVKPIYYNVSFNNQQNQTLSQIRDTLLPKLMSGDVRVK